MVSTNKRREKDVMKLLVSEYEVALENDSSTSEFFVKFFGPKDSPYEGVSTLAPWAPSFSPAVFSLSTGHLEDQGDSPRQLPLQVAFDRVHKQDLPSKY